MEILHSDNSAKCDNCEKVIDIPKHCGKSMELVENQWICWKGEHPPCCGKASVIEYDACCDNPSL